MKRTTIFKMNKSKKTTENKVLKERKETDLQKIVNHYFKTKGLTLDKIKKDAKKKKIIYSRHIRPAKELLELAGTATKAKQAITTVANWANTRELDYTIETVLKKWLELDKLKPKKKKIKPFYDGKEMREKNKKWYVIGNDGEWLEFADKKDKIEWKSVK